MLLVWLLLLLGLACCSAAPSFAPIDQRALAAPASEEVSIERLSKYLCPRKYSESEKARSIFRWVADRIQYDVEALHADKLPSQEAEDVLQKRRAVCAGYSKLYEALAEKAGLDVSYISGESPFNDQLPRLPKGVSGHGWNAVLLNGRWRLLDVTWASGHINQQGQFQKQFNDFWYCTPPEHFVYTHLPKQDRWQLLSRPISSKQFAGFPRLSGEFFRLGLKLPEKQSQPLQVSGEGLIWLEAPQNVLGSARLNDAQGKSLDRYTLTSRRQGRLETRLRCPGPGKYKIQLFAGQKVGEGQESSQEYLGVANYAIECRRGQDQIFPFTFGIFARSEAELLEPDQGILKAGSLQSFRIRFPNSSEVQEVRLFSNSQPLDKLQLQKGIYQGKFELPKSPGKLRLSVATGQARQYWHMLEYELR